MSQNGHCKRTREALEALDFRLDEDACRTGVWVYWHPNDASQRVRVFAGISEMAARKVRIKADDIAGLSSHGESAPTSISEIARVKRQQAKAKKAAAIERENRAREPFQAAADERARRLREAARIERAEARRREITDLMRAGRTV